MEASGVEVLDWPVMSPDLNIIEKFSEKIIMRRVYANGRQFNSVVDLQDSTMDAWNSIYLHYV